jgi:hypothetical protein
MASKALARKHLSQIKYGLGKKALSTEKSRSFFTKYKEPIRQFIVKYDGFALPIGNYGN